MFYILSFNFYCFNTVDDSTLSEKELNIQISPSPKDQSKLNWKPYHIFFRRSLQAALPSFHSPRQPLSPWAASSLLV